MCHCQLSSARSCSSCSSSSSSSSSYSYVFGVYSYPPPALTTALPPLLHATTAHRPNPNNPAVQFSPPSRRPAPQDRHNGPLHQHALPPLTSLGHPHSL